MPEFFEESTSLVIEGVHSISLSGFRAMAKQDLVCGLHPSPFGQVLVAVAQGSLCGFLFQGTIPKDYFLVQAAAHLKVDLGYFDSKTTLPFLDQVLAGERPPLLLSGTPFQLKVWVHLLAIKKGEIITYQELAEKIGFPRAMRSIGQALKANPLAYVLPCHRIVSSSGKWGGYRWGSSLKKKLIEKEQE
jgi:AraC family transcriptional regulator of adaptative response/methylated-DNA-[protein]-cysteine methyltransferase